MTGGSGYTGGGGRTRQRLVPTHDPGTDATLRGSVQAPRVPPAARSGRVSGRAEVREGLATPVGARPSERTAVCCRGTSGRPLGELDRCYSSGSAGASPSPAEAGCAGDSVNHTRAGSAWYNSRRYSEQEHEQEKELRGRTVQQRREQTARREPCPPRQRRRTDEAAPRPYQRRGMRWGQTGTLHLAAQQRGPTNGGGCAGDSARDTEI
jgi:hypothetical protein